MSPSQLFLDTANIDEIKHILRWGVIDGLTTNQKIFLNEKGVDFKKRAQEILRLVDGPVSLELTTKSVNAMVKEAQEYYSWNKDKVVVKVAMSGDGLGLETIHQLKKRGIPVNATVMMKASQAILAAKAGAKYVSLFYRRMMDAGEDPQVEIGITRRFLDQSGLDCKIIAGSIREPDDVVLAMDYGAHVPTVPYKMFLGMITHPKSEETIKEFDDSWRQFIATEKTLPYSFGPSMVTTRTPLRISFGGGGTDLPFYSSKYDGYVISGAIDKYIYVTVAKSISGQNIVRYEDIEKVSGWEELNHGIIREIVNYFQIKEPLEITVSSSVPGGTGMGSSSALAVGLIKALVELTGQQDLYSENKIAEVACYIERDVLQEVGGKQDQYISSLGGIQEMNFLKDGSVNTSNLKLKEKALSTLENNLALIYLGKSRSSSNIQASVSSNENLNEKIKNMHFIKDIGVKIKKALIEEKFDDIGKLWHVHWEAKKKLSKAVSSNEIDKYYETGIKHGAMGGKVLGAGGGGFLLFYSPNAEKLSHYFERSGLKNIPFHFNEKGSEVFYTE